MATWACTLPLNSSAGIVLPSPTCVTLGMQSPALGRRFVCSVATATVETHFLFTFFFLFPSLPHLPLLLAFVFFLCSEASSGLNELKLNSIWFTS